MTTSQLFETYYYSRPTFRDGTTEFHQLCAEFIVGGDILEIGAGPTNRTSAFLSSRGTVTGLDVSPEVLQNKYLDDARVYDGGRFPFADGSFSACIADFVLEHVADPEQHLGEVRRVLRPGGVYCFRTPNLWHYVTLGSKVIPHSWHIRLANLLRGYGKDAHDPYPTVYAANTRGKLRSLCAGMSIEVLRTVEKEPSYGKLSPVLFFPMMGYERLVNSSDLFEPLRVNIFGVMRKPSGV